MVACHCRRGSQRATREFLPRAFAIIAAMTRESARARRVFQTLILVVAMAVAFLGGMLVERLQFHAERDAMLRRYDQALREHRARVMEAEKRGKKLPGSPSRPPGGPPRCPAGTPRSTARW